MINPPNVRKSPDRHIKNYQFYFNNFNKIEPICSGVDLDIYGVLKHKCLNTVDRPVSGKNICACLYDKRGKIISTGINSFNKSHPIQERFGSDSYKIFLHAEIDAVVRALRKVKYDSLSGFNLAITRVCQDGSDAQAFPCDGCIEALKYYKCDSITYFDDTRGLSKFKFR